MAIGEDRKIILRGVTRRGVETFLLVLGLALGIGASAAGIALVGRALQTSEELLASPDYREIIVSDRENATEMDAPLLAIDDDDRVVLTSIDLRAAQDAPDVEYAYIKQERGFRNVLGLLGRMQAGGGSPQGGAALVGGGNTVSGGNTGRLELTLDGPTPILDEWSGYGVTPEFFNAFGLTAAEGSLFTVEDIASGNNKVMVLGSELATTLFEDGVSLGRQIIDFRSLTTVSGVLAPTGTALDKLAFVPAFMPDASGNIESTEMARFAGFAGSSLSFMVADASRLDEASDQLRQYFEREYGADSVVFSLPREEVEATRDRNRRLTTIILFLGLSGLFIAGVNVSNILASRAMRRQKTIGILKALGAGRNNIFRLFFTEALSIGAAGTLVGVGIAVLLAGLMERTIDIGAMSPIMLAVGIGISWIIVTVLTVFPAMQASRVPAAEATRME